MRATYQVVKAMNIEELSKAVNNWCQYGWRPTGGIAFTPSGQPRQALVNPKRRNALDPIKQRRRQ